MSNPTHKNETTTYSNGTITTSFEPAWFLGTSIINGRTAYNYTNGNETYYTYEELEVWA
jgi:hypothetical protein